MCPPSGPGPWYVPRVRGLAWCSASLCGSRGFVRNNRLGAPSQSPHPTTCPLMGRGVPIINHCTILHAHNLKKQLINPPLAHFTLTLPTPRMKCANAITSPKNLQKSRSRLSSGHSFSRPLPGPFSGREAWRALRAKILYKSIEKRNDFLGLCISRFLGVPK